VSHLSDSKEFAIRAEADTGCGLDLVFGTPGSVARRICPVVGDTLHVLDLSVCTRQRNRSSDGALPTKRGTGRECRPDKPGPPSCATLIFPSYTGSAFL